MNYSLINEKKNLCYIIKTMDSKTIVMCVVALLLGMLLANMLKNVCGCRKKKVVEPFGKLYHDSVIENTTECLKCFAGANIPLVDYDLTRHCKHC